MMDWDDYAMLEREWEKQRAAYKESLRNGLFVRVEVTEVYYRPIRNGSRDRESRFV